MQATRQQWESGRDQIEQLALEASLIGASSEARTRAIALLQIEQQIRRAGIEAGSAEAQMLREQTARIADQVIALERRQDAWSTYAGAGESALDTLGDAIAEQKTSWEDWADVIDDVVTDINKSLLRLTVINPLKNALFGTNAGTLEDLASGTSGGGLFGQLLRGAGVGGTSSATVGVTGASSAIASGALGTALNPMWVQIVGSATGMLGNLLGGDSKAASGLNTSFSDALSRMIADAKSAGHDISITSGYRSLARQQQLWDDALAKYGSADLARKWVAPPGNSQHNYGLAADLGYGSSAARSWAQNNADNYGLNFPLSNENWHIEPVGARSGAYSAAIDPSRELSSALGTATQSVNQFGTGISDVARTATSATGDLSVSTGQLASASESAAASATSFTGGLEGAFGQILGGLGQIGSGFLNGFGSILESLLGGLGSGGGGSLISGIAGLFGFANGGIMTSAGPLPLRAYVNGGVASSPQLALFGEGEQNEAFVPLPDGRRIPVALSLNSKVAGGADSSAFAAASALNAQNGASAPNLSVNIQTLPGTTAEVSEPQPDGNGGYSVDVAMRQMDGRIVDDVRKGGPISKVLEKQYGLKRTRGMG